MFNFEAILDARGIDHGDSISDIPLPGSYLSQFQERLLGFDERHHFPISKRVLVSGEHFVSSGVLAKKAYITGFFQDSKFPVMAKDMDLFRDFVTSPKTKYFQQLFEKIRENNATLIHVRLGDYVNGAKTLGNLSVNYYKGILEENHDISNNPIYLVSDDPKRAKQLLPALSEFKIEILEKDPGISNFDYLRLFSAAERIVCANSTFSWWGAFLAENCKNIYAPSPWYFSKELLGTLGSTFYPTNFSLCKAEWSINSQ